MLIDAYDHALNVYVMISQMALTVNNQSSTAFQNERYLRLFLTALLLLKLCCIKLCSVTQAIIYNAS